MSTLVTMTQDEVERIPLTADEIKVIRMASDKAISGRAMQTKDCPVQTKDELSKFRPWYEAHPRSFSYREQDEIVRIPLTSAARESALSLRKTLFEDRRQAKRDEVVL